MVYFLVNKKEVKNMKTLQKALFLLIFFIIALKPMVLTAQTQVLLTENERDYLNTYGAITLCVDPDWYPFEEITSEGTYRGISRDLISIIEERLDISFTLIKTASWSETVEKYENKECDVVSFLNQTIEREIYLNFTDTYFSDQNVLITRNETPYIADLSQVTSAKIALPLHTSVSYFITQNYPNLEIVAVETEKEAFQKVENGEADMTIRSMIISAYTIRNEGLFNLRINGQIPEEYNNDLKMGVKKEAVLLRDILNKTIATITPLDRQEVLNRHVYIVVEGPTNYEMVGRIFLLSVFVIGLVLFWAHKLKRLNINRELLLNNIPTQIWYFIDEQTYGMVNQAYASFLGMKLNDIMFQSLQEVQGNRMAEFFIEKNKWIFKHKERLQYEAEIERNDGFIRTLSILQTPILNKNQEVEYIVCSAEDITDQKIQKQQVEYLTIHDQLTGLKNRRYFDDLVQNIQIVDVFPLSFLMLDLNGLKLINDAFGHLQGDKAIIMVADAIKHHIRAEDIAIRLSGDEFVIFFFQTSKQDALSIGRNIQEEIDNKKKMPFKLSVSWGLGTTESQEDSVFDVYKRAESYMYKRKLHESSTMHNTTIDVILETLFDRSVLEQLHAESVKRISVLFGEKLGLNMFELKELEIASFMHDIGKASLDVGLLHKDAKLDRNELEDVRKHAEVGYRILNSTNIHSTIARYILSHHERFDGTGYPKGLRGEEIPLISRIIHLVESYDHMTRNLPYKNAFSKEEAIQELIMQKNKQFDGKLVDIFIELIETGKLK